MFNNTLRSVLRSVLAATAVILLGTGPADAGNVRLSWDPSFGSPYPDLGFGGVGHLQYPNGCLATTGIVDPATNPCNTGAPPADQIMFTDMVLNLFDLTVDPTMSGTPAQTLNFIADVFPSDITNIVVGQDPVTLLNKVVGLNTDIFGFETSPAVGSVFPGGDVWVQFVTTFNGGSPTCPIDGTCIPDKPQSFMYVANADGAFRCPNGDGTTACTRSNPALVSISIPEPGTIALLLAALGASGLLGRRRQRG